MLPLAQRMVDDGITLIVRGQKNADKLKAPLRSGAVENGIEYLFPLEDWTDEEVYAFLAREGIERLPFYESMSTTPDCMTCSAWWSDGRAAYLRERHPAHYEVYQQRLNTSSDEAAAHIAAFNVEISHPSAT
ncbi:hypothetical protein PQR33_14920 [Paraburkholderia sediminicola]|uniref:hypothetical protein n=1 Tax=Paraburkholderia sediminicola TaxID=458836 RepID=UPI0038BCA66D